jgi:hypothetical protein
MATIDELGARAGERVRAQVRPYVSTEAPAFPQRPFPRRWAVVAAAVLVVGTLITLAVTGSRPDDHPPASDTTVGSTTTTTTTTTTTGKGTDLEGNGLVFHLPPSFRYSTEGFTSTGEGYGSFYSNAPLPHGPCTDGCGIGNLAPKTPNAIVIGIGSYELPLDPNDHANTTIAGFDAHFVSTTECGDELISVRFEQDTFGSTIVRACLSGPDLADGERTVREILASATPTGGATTSTTAVPDIDATLDPSTATDGTDLRILWHGQHVRWHAPPSVVMNDLGVGLPDGSYVVQPVVDPAEGELIVRLFPDGSYTWWRLPKLVLGSENGITFDAQGVHVLTLVGLTSFKILEWPLPPNP